MVGFGLQVYCLVHAPLPESRLSISDYLDNNAKTLHLVAVKSPKKAVLVGNPNVGKSVLFNALTGATVTVSNYPGTTVMLASGRFIYGTETCEVIDTPGMYSFLSITEEERITRSMFLAERPDVVINVIDARNIRRMLPLTLQLIEAELLVILVLNMTDEAQAAGLHIDSDILSRELGIPVVPTVATKKTGVDRLREVIFEIARKRKAYDAVS